MPHLLLFIAFAASDMQIQAWRRRSDIFLPYRSTFASYRARIRRLYKTSFNSVIIVLLIQENRLTAILEDLGSAPAEEPGEFHNEF